MMVFNTIISYTKRFSVIGFWLVLIGVRSVVVGPGRFSSLYGWFSSPSGQLSSASNWSTVSGRFSSISGWSASVFGADQTRSVTCRADVPAQSQSYTTDAKGKQNGARR